MIGKGTLTNLLYVVKEQEKRRTKSQDSVAPLLLWLPGGRFDYGQPEFCRSGSCGCSSTVEPQPSKLMMWVRFPSPAPEPVCDRCWSPYLEHSALIAQAVEHSLGKGEVTGSNPVVGTIKYLVVPIVCGL